MTKIEVKNSLMREWDWFEWIEWNTVPVSAKLLSRREVLRIEVAVTGIGRSVHRHFFFHWNWEFEVSEWTSERTSEWANEWVSLNPHSAREANGWGLVKTLRLRLRCASRIQVASTSPSHFSIHIHAPMFLKIKFTLLLFTSLYEIL